MMELLTNQTFWTGLCMVLSFLTGKYHLVGKTATFAKSKITKQ